MTSQTHAELAAERDRLAAAHKAALDALERERERTATLREALEAVDRMYGDVSAGGTNCRPTVRQLNETWAIIRSALASVKAE